MAKLNFKHLPTFAQSAADMTVKGIDVDEIAYRLDTQASVIRYILSDPLIKDYMGEQQERQNRRFNATTELKRIIPKVLRKAEAILDSPEATFAEQLRAAALLGNWAGLSKLKLSIDEESPTEAVNDYLQFLSEKHGNQD